MRALPRPQIRSDPAAGLLRSRGDFPFYRDALRNSRRDPESAAVGADHFAGGLRGAGAPANDVRAGEGAKGAATSGSEDGAARVGGGAFPSQAPGRRWRGGSAAE